MSHERLTVLVVDDDPGLLRTLAEILEASDYRVWGATTGNEAISLAEETDFDLVIVEQQLPDLSARDVIQRLDSIQPSAEVLLVTPPAPVESSLPAPGSGIGTLAKPIDVHELLQAARRVAESKELQRVNRRLHDVVTEAKKQWERTFDAISDPIAIADGEGNLVRVNRAFAERFGAPYRHLIGKRDSTVIYGVEAHPLAVSGRRAALQGRTFAEECDELTISGNFSVACYPVDLQAGPGVIHILRDVTDQRRAEEDRRQLEQQIQKIQRMESVGRLAGGVAHDFNNLLTVILGNLEFLERSLDEGSDLVAFLTQAKQAASRASELTRQLVTFARQQETAENSLDLNALLAEVEGLLHRTMGEDIELRIEPFEGLWPVQIDLTQMTQVLLNLAANARDAMPDGGTVVIETRNLSFDRKQVREFPELEPGDYVELRVIDSGTGMSSEVQIRLFEPFFTTKEVGQGTGLGLATCYGIVARAGGCVRVDSAPGEGSCFALLLPRAGSRDGRSVGDSPDPVRLMGNERILLVEDDVTVRETVAPGLRSFGYRVREAESAVQALQLLESGEEVDLMISDIVMPTMNGFELAERAAQLRKGLKTLLVSGYPPESINRRRGYRSDDAWLRKPYTTGELAHKIRQLIDRASAGEPCV